MNFASYIYLFNVAGKINAVLEVGIVLGGVVTFAMLMGGWMMADTSWGYEEEKKRSVYRATRRAVKVLAVCAALYAVVPNTGTLYTMAAAAKVEEISKSPDVQKLAGNSLKVLEKKMQEYLNEKE